MSDRGGGGAIDGGGGGAIDDGRVIDGKGVSDRAERDRER